MLKKYYKNCITRVTLFAMWIGENSNRKDVISMSSKFTTKLLLLSAFVFMLIGSTVYSVSTGIFGGGAGVAKATQIADPPVNASASVKLAYTNPLYENKPGAILQLFNTNGIDIYTDDTQVGNDIETTNEVADVGVLEAGSYILKVESPAPGYQISDDIKFTVDSDGKVTIGGSPSSNNTVSISAVPIVTKIIVKKVDERGNPLANAKLGFGDVKDIVDSPYTYYEWTTDETGEKEIEVYVDIEYYLHEDNAPYGYSIADEIPFKLTADERLEEIRGYEDTIDNTGDIPVLKLVNKKIVETASSETQEPTDKSTDDDSQVAYSIATGENTNLRMLFAIVALSAFIFFSFYSIKSKQKDK